MKKYIENPDGTGIPDHVAAQQAWDVHRKRNNSIIIDLFYVSHITDGILSDALSLPDMWSVIIGFIVLVQLKLFHNISSS